MLCAPSTAPRSAVSGVPPTRVALSARASSAPASPTARTSSSTGSPPAVSGTRRSAAGAWRGRGTRP
eukprot:152619-Lingulodinium_polyedra.AAC.1